MISFEKFDILKKTALLALILLGCKNYAQEIPATYLHKINASNYRVDTANEDGRIKNRFYIRFGKGESALSGF